MKEKSAKRKILSDADPLVSAYLIDSFVTIKRIALNR